MLPPDPKSVDEHTARWPLAVADVWDYRGELPPDTDRPGLHPDHLFDFRDGLRLLVSTDRYDFGDFLHVSASCQPDSPIWHRVVRRELTRNGLLEEVRSIVLGIGGRAVSLGYWSEMRGIPHLFDPDIKPFLRLEDLCPNRS